jgi:GT2 family glycosyltransferase
MNRVCVFTFTRDRLDSTKHCFAELKELAGVPYDHIVVDQGSIDGTPRWLYGTFDGEIRLLTENIGIHKGVNLVQSLLDTKAPYDYVLKFDNDCEPTTQGFLKKLMDVADLLGPSWVLSPKVDGINHQPGRGRTLQVEKNVVGETHIVGGLCKLYPYEVFMDYQPKLNLPPGFGDDDYFAKVWQKEGGHLGYVETVEVNHYLTTDGQAARWPEYFKRKWQETDYYTELHRKGEFRGFDEKA